MIDLSYQGPEARGKRKEDETPIGVVILGLLPFCLGFVWMVFQGLLH